jgi:hypothetical protein
VPPVTTVAGGATPATAPAGWPLLVDSTGAIQVNVPAEWTDVDLAPDAMDDGTPVPQITASSSLADFEASFATSGVIFSQYPFSATPEEVLAQYVPGPCGAETTEAYDDGVFQGQLRHQTQCGQTGEYYTLAATTASRPGAVFVVEVGIASAAETATVEGVLSTFNIAGAAAPSPSTPAASVPGAATQAATTSAMTQLVDDTGRVTVAVPTSWTQVSTAPLATGQARLVASPDLTVFSPELLMIPTNYTVPGVFVMSADGQLSDPGEMASLLPFTDCTAGPVTPYADATFTGGLVMRTCGGTAQVAVLSANRNDGSATVTAVVLLPQPDDALLNAILGSLDGDQTN